MRIGLVRHFKVLKEFPLGIKMVSQSQILEWFNEYDKADIEVSNTQLGNIDWDVCYTSDLHRAKKTANSIFNGQIIENEDLREIKFYPIFKKDIRLPLIFWPVLIRLAWYFNHKSQIKHKIESLKKIKDFVEEILSSQLENVLIVSHAALILYLRKELIRCGFRGPRFRKARNGRLYVYELITHRL